MKLTGHKNILRLSVLLPALVLLTLYYFTGTSLSDTEENKKQDSILLNQLGYRLDDFKIANVKAASPDTFIIIDAVTNEIAFKGKFNNIIEFDRATGDNLYTLNFSTLTRPGDYKISVPAISETSYEFSISNNVYNECAIKTVESFYYQRCGVEVNNGTQWKHPICHVKYAKFYSDPAKEKNTTGGWHDAGDYNKFVPTTAVSAAFLLYAYENNPEFFYDGQLNIPESGNSIPDILDEASWALKWLLKMQREDGAVYHKVSIKKWTGEHLPEDETDVQYIFGISSTSTAGVAAVTALGARLLGDYNKQLSMKLLKCAVNAWSFLKLYSENIPQGGFKNPHGVEGGEYGDDNDSDERLWASVELFRLTGSERYLNYFLSNFKKVGGPNYTISWKNTANFAYYSFLKLHPLNNIEVRSLIISNMQVYCNELVGRIEQGGYKCVLNNDEYYWGSNSVVAGYAYDLLNLYLVTKQRRYIVAALDQFHYLLGRNTFGISFVTGVGTNSVKYPYHQFSMLKYSDNPVPGLLVAGPNNYSKLNGKKISEMPGKCYEDYEKNYYVNEVAINYTAPLVYVASFFSLPVNNSLSKENIGNANKEIK